MTASLMEHFKRNGRPELFFSQRAQQMLQARIKSTEAKVKLAFDRLDNDQARISEVMYKIMDANSDGQVTRKEFIENYCERFHLVPFWS